MPPGRCDPDSRRTSEYANLRLLPVIPVQSEAVKGATTVMVVYLLNGYWLHRQPRVQRVQEMPFSVTFSYLHHQTWSPKGCYLS